MKTNRVIWMVGVLAVILTDVCHANFNGKDDFNGPTKDTSKWGVNFTNGVGLLTQTNGHLRFRTTGAPTETDFAAWPWILNYGSYTQAWEFHLDVNVPVLSLDATQYLSFLIAVFPGGNPSMMSTNAFSMELRQNSSEHSFKSQIRTDKIQSSPWPNKITASTFAALRVAFDSSTQTLSAFYDEDGPNCGYSWTLLASTNVPAGWNMTSNSVFGILVVGIANYVSVDYTNNLFADNFCASSEAIPRLGITSGSGKVVISWPTNTMACRLESASTLIPPICWQATTSTPGIVSTNFTVTNAISSGSTFYRLSR